MAQRREPYERTEDTAEYYVDAVHIESQLYGSTLYLGELRQDQALLAKAVIKVSPQMAKVLSLILSKHVRLYESDIGPIEIPPATRIPESATWIVLEPLLMTVYPLLDFGSDTCYSPPLLRLFNIVLPH